MIFSRVVEDGQLIMKPTPVNTRLQKLLDYFATTVQLYFSYMEKMLPPAPADASSPSLHLVGDRLTVADLAFWDVYTFLEKTREPEDFSSFMAQFPQLQALAEKLNNLPWIKAHLEKMPNKSIAFAFKPETEK